MLPAVTSVGARIRIFSSGDFEQTLIVLVKTIHIVFVKCDFPTLVTLLMNNLMGSMDTF